MSDLDAAIARADALAFAQNGKHLNDLQRAILMGVWRGDRYAAIAERCGYTEGHIKDVGAELWKLLSQASGDRIGKSTFRSAIFRAPLPAASPESKPQFFGRAGAVAELATLVGQGNRAIVIQGEGGVGKTTLAQHYLARGHFDCLLELWMAKDARNLVSPAAIAQEWLRQDLNVEPGQDFATNLARLQRELRTRRAGVLIDNIEPALDRNGCFSEPHRDFVELLRLLSHAGPEVVVVVTSRDRLCEADLNLAHVRLPGLDKTAWEDYFSTLELELDREIAVALHRTYGGNAKAMGVIGGLIATDFDRNGRAYWQELGDEPLAEISLKNLIAAQFDRLQTLDPNAYRLLCRLGCYRYQDIPRVPTAGLRCLLWEEASVAVSRQAIASLQNRSLVEQSCGEYWLHPVIRAEAIVRLQNTPDWERAHRQAAAFWRDRIDCITGIVDAQIAFEAYYHERAIGDWEAAARTLLKGRTNQWGQFLSLGSNLYRLGLVQPTFAAILELCQCLSNSELLAELENILGDLYWILGRVDAALACQQKTLQLAREFLQSLDPESCSRRDVNYFQMLEVDSNLSIGLYCLDLGEYERAATAFSQVIALADNSDRQGWADKARVGLALARSRLDDLTSARDTVKRLDVLLDALDDGRWAYFLQLLGQTYIHLGETEKAQELSQRAITAARSGQYPQVEAKALLCLAQIAADTGDCSTARLHCEVAIAKLEALDARCDLAIACDCLGAILARIGEIADSQQYCDRAIALFEQIKAPKQVQAVRARLAS